MFRHSIRWLACFFIASLLIAGCAHPPKTQFYNNISTNTQHDTAISEQLSNTSNISSSLEEPSVLTDENGYFRFDGLRHSSHILRIDPLTIPGGDSLPTENLVLTLSPGANLTLAVKPDLALQASYHRDGSVLDGVLFNDSNGNRIQDADERGVAGVRVIDPDLYQYYVPFNDDDLQTSFADMVTTDCASNTPDTPSTSIESNISLTSSADNTIVYYDHWEDGYDPDPLAPGPTTEQITLNRGQVETWSNQINTPRSAAVFRYDGRDRITVVGQPVSAVRAAWLSQPGTLLAGAWEMSRVSDWGLNYYIPVGEDLGLGVNGNVLRDFDYVSASIMAAYDGTIVQIDANADGVFERTETLNAGQTTFIRGSVAGGVANIAIHSGAQVSASLPVQVQVRAGSCSAAYAGRSYTLVPEDNWSNDYWAPISSFVRTPGVCTVGYGQPQVNNSADVDIYIMNPHNTPLTVNYENADGAGTITIPPRTTSSYLQLLSQANAPLGRSNTQGVHLFASQSFWAVTVVDTTSLGNNGSDFDWSYSLIPSNQLSSRVVLSWAPGNAEADPTTAVNGSTVYVQATVDGTVIRVDLDGDGIADAFDIDGDGFATNTNAYGYDETTSANGITLNRGQTLRVSDPNDHDMTGAVISSQNNAFPIAVMYGEDACRAERALPYIDVGYTVLPLPVPEFSKSAQLVVDADGSGDMSPGDIIEYRVQAYNNDINTLVSPVISDTLPYTYSQFLIGSISSIPAPIQPFKYDDGSGAFTYEPKDPAGTPDPNIRRIQAQFPDLQPGDSIQLTMRVQLNDPFPLNISAITNHAWLHTNGSPPITTSITTPLNQVDLLVHKTDGLTYVNPPNQLTYTLTYTNAGPGIAYNTIMTDTLPPGAYNVTALNIPGVITSTVEPTQVIFQLGTLQPNQTGQATVSLTLPTSVRDPVINTVEIRTRSHEYNLTNNTSIDIDHLLPADLLISKDDGKLVVENGEQLTYTLIYTNAGPGIAYNTIITDTLPPGVLNVSTPTVPGVITPTIEPGRVILRLGTLLPNTSGRTTISLTLPPNLPVGVDIVNRVDITSNTPDPDPGNNTDTDVDRSRSTAAVVLSEFWAQRQTGYVELNWRTLAEFDNYGFRLYRSSTPNRADAVLLTEEIIPGQGRGRVGGATYQYIDTDPLEGASYYWLEDIDLNGKSTFHGPAQPRLQSAGTRILVPMVWN